MRWRAIFALVPLGCGPSFQSVYESDVRFEHCYALDETPSTSLQKKAECWHEWSAGYTQGQTRDRVEYAASRYRLLTSPQLPTDEAMMQAAPGMIEDRGQLTAPTPTNAFAPPPSVERKDAEAPSTDAGADAKK